MRLLRRKRGGRRSRGCYGALGELLRFFPFDFAQGQNDGFVTLRRGAARGGGCEGGVACGRCSPR
jgi:hypothetical protein